MSFIILTFIIAGTIVCFTIISAIVISWNDNETVIEVRQFIKKLWKGQLK